MPKLVRDGAVRERPASRQNSPTQEGELEATRIRLVITAMSLVAIAAMWLAKRFVSGAELELFAAMAGWFFVGPLFLLLAGRGAYRPWMSYVSVGVDLAFMSAVSFAVMAARDYNFTGGLLDAVSFVVILLAGVRRGAALVVVTSVAAAIAHLVVSGVFFGEALSLHSVYLAYDGRIVQGISFIDNITKALCMVIVGWLIAYVTRGLRSSERHYKDLFESIPDGIAIANARGVVVNVNQRFSSMVGGDAPALSGALLNDLIRLDASGSALAPIPPTALAGRTMHLMRADGTRVPVRIATAPMRLAGGDGVVVSVRDVTDRAHLESELAQSRKMDSIGRLAGGLAHDFNNILGGILGAASIAEHVLDRVPEEHRERLRRQVAMIRDAGRSARDVVKKLLDFSRTPSSETKRFSLVQVVADVETLCRKTLGESISVEVAFAAKGEPWVEGDEGALKQALLSLCLNAGDSMRKGGRISLRLEDAPSTRSFFANHPDATPEAAYVCAAVEQGGGDDARLIERAPGVLVKLARQHHGFVDVTRTPQSGTSIRMYLPRAASAPQAGA
jgi:PAS domain S-box-containing protein